LKNPINTPQFYGTKLVTKNEQDYNEHCGRLGSLMVSVLDSVANASGLSPGWERCVVFMGKTLNLAVPLSTQVYKKVEVNLVLGVNPAMD